MNAIEKIKEAKELLLSADFRPVRALDCLDEALAALESKQPAETEEGGLGQISLLIARNKTFTAKTVEKILAFIDRQVKENAELKSLIKSLISDLASNDMQSLEATLNHWKTINLPKDGE
ncbi:MAG: hypothetical protein WC389_10915 [Lutibacter sp.]|jgi:hypothetical protein